MFYKETKNGIITGIQQTDGTPQADGYEYTEISESEHEAIKADMLTSQQSVVVPSAEERIAALEEIIDTLLTGGTV